VREVGEAETAAEGESFRVSEGERQRRVSII